MLCRLYGLPNCYVFKSKWAPVAHHVLATDDSFPSESMLALELKISIQDYQKATARKKPNFFFSAFIYDILCAEFEYPNLEWKWSFSAPLVPIYYSELWDTNYAPRFYDICQHFLGTIYFSIFKKEAPAFSPEATGLIGTMGDWYVGDNFSYMRIWGSNTVHVLPRIVPDRLVLEEVAFQTVNDGVYKKLIGPKKKAWTKFPLNL